MSACRYVFPYQYDVYEKQLGAGGQATVFLSLGKLKRKNGKLDFLRAGTKKPMGRKRKSYIAKIFHFKNAAALGAADAEAYLSKDFLHTKGFTNISQENKNGGDAELLRIMKQGKVEGKSLEDLIDEGKINSLSEQKIRLVVINLYKALQELHAAGIVHRDIKPANIMLDIKSLKVTIIDFGFAEKAYAPALSTPGTVGYIPPEVYNRDKNFLIAPEQDVYAMGMVARDLLRDKIFSERENLIRMITQEQLYLFLQMEHQLGLSIKPASIPQPPDITEMRSVEDTAVLNRILTETTKTLPAERMSIKKVLSLLEENKYDAKDEKSPEQKNPSAFMRARDPTRQEISRLLPLVRKTLFFELLVEMKAYVATLPETDPTRDTLKKAIEEIGRIRPEALEEAIPDVLINASHMLLKAKYFHQFENLTEDQHYDIIDDNLYALQFLKDALEGKQQNTEEMKPIAPGTLKEAAPAERVLAEQKISETQQKKIEAKEADPRSFLKKSWDETFLPPGTAPEDSKKFSADRYFFGLPPVQRSAGKEILSLIGYTFGFIWLVAVKNTVKLCIEFPFKLISEGIKTGHFALKDWQTTSTAGKIGRVVALSVVDLGGGIFFAIFKPLHLLARAILSPVDSVRGITAKPHVEPKAAAVNLDAGMLNELGESPVENVKVTHSTSRSIQQLTNGNKKETVEILKSEHASPAPKAAPEKETPRPVSSSHVVAKEPLAEVVSETRARAPSMRHGA